MTTFIRNINKIHNILEQRTDNRSILGSVLVEYQQNPGITGT